MDKRSQAGELDLAVDCCREVSVTIKLSGFFDLPQNLAEYRSRRSIERRAPEFAHLLVSKKRPFGPSLVAISIMNHRRAHFFSWPIIMSRQLGDIEFQAQLYH